MQKSSLFAKKSISQLLLPVIAIVFLWSITSCSDSKSKPSPACIKITSSQIQTAWVDKNFTKPGTADVINWIQVNTTKNATGDYNIEAVGVRADSTQIAGSEIKLSMDPSCSMPGSINIGKNFIKIADLNILEADGTLKRFESITLVPQDDPTNRGYMNYTASVMASDGSTLTAKGTLPCPPCEYCIPKCKTTDSTEAHSGLDPKPADPGIK